MSATDKLLDELGVVRRLPVRSAAAEPLMLNPKAPMESARLFLTAHFTKDGERTLHHQNDTFYGYNGTHYPELDSADVRSRTYAFFDSAFRATGKGKRAPFNPNRTSVGDALDALKAVANLPSSVQAPTWLGGQAGPPAHEVIACTNGLLHLNTRKLLPPTPKFFTQNALPFPFDSTAPEPTEFLKFLDSIWPGDHEAIDTLQEMTGYFLTADTRHQKAFLIIGPKRSGKGTLARILTQLLGPANTVGPTLGGLATNFGLSPLIGKRLAIISDARLGGRSDPQALAERLLAITGEDALTIDRKFQSAWTGRLQTRFLILSNELPNLSDASGALASRFVVLTLTKSFYGAEDLGLTDRLTTELPGILNWAIDGWVRLNERGYFRQPMSSAESIQELEDLGSPIGAFLRDTCDIAPGHTVVVDYIYDRWLRWCREQGRDRPGTKAMFGRNLHAKLPTIKKAQPRDGDERVPTYLGLSLK